jgi:hypothetical protein
MYCTVHCHHCKENWPTIWLTVTRQFCFYWPAAIGYYKQSRLLRIVDCQQQTDLELGTLHVNCFLIKYICIGCTLPGNVVVQCRDSTVYWCDCTSSESKWKVLFSLFMVLTCCVNCNSVTGLSVCFLFHGLWLLSLLMDLLGCGGVTVRPIVVLCCAVNRRSEEEWRKLLFVTYIEGLVTQIWPIL